MTRLLKAILAVCCWLSLTAFAQQTAPAATISVTLNADQDRFVRATAADIVKCASVRLPNGTASIQIEFYPTGQNTGQLVALALDSARRSMPIASCDANLMAAKINSLAPLLQKAQGEQYAGYLFASSLDVSTISVRFITVAEEQRANARNTRAPAK